MKKKAIILLLAITSANICAYGQSRTGTFSIIPKIGTNISNATGNELFTDNSVLKSKSKAGLAFGVDVQYQISKALAMSLGIGYSRQGYRYADYQSTVTTTDDYTEYEGVSDHHQNIDYLTMPLTLHCYVEPNLAIGVGIQTAFIIDSKYIYETSTFKEYGNGMREYTTNTLRHEVECTSAVLKKADFSIPLSVSYEYMNVVVAATYNIGLTNFNKSPLPKSKNKVISFTAGYRFSL